MIEGLVAIIGRPNVGKSTIFNRLTRSDKAIIDDQPGVTRDRLYGVVLSNDISESEDEDTYKDGYTVIDTGGFETKDLYYQPFAKNIVWEQTDAAIKESDVVMMVFDAKSGLHPHDRELVQYLKKLEKRVVYVCNKIDGQEQQTLMWEFYELGLGDDILFCSAAHNRGIWDVSGSLEEALQEVNRTNIKTEDKDATKIALIGRPNAGKSSILNRICGESRALVSDIAGTTRDSIDSPFVYNNKPYVLIDTAGIRRKTKILDKIENMSVIKSLRAIERADVVVLVITANEKLSDQDARLASLAISRHKPVLIVVNKWDLFENKESNSTKEFAADIHHQVKDISYVPILFTSCVTNQRVHKIMSEVEKLTEVYNKRVSTSDINLVLEKAIHRHTPALVRKLNKRVKFYFATQVKTAPPTIVIKCNVAGEIQESYKRYLTNFFRKELGFKSIPIRLLYRDKKQEKKTREKLLEKEITIRDLNKQTRKEKAEKRLEEQRAKLEERKR